MTADPRDIVTVMHGTPLRDGAVDPQPEDFLGPTNAGAEGELGNPHGPFVVNPEIHGTEDNRTIPAGAVGTPAEQETKAYANLAEWQPQTDAPAWATATDYAAGSYVSLTDGTVLYTEAGGTSGAEAPTGPGTDGTVVWVAA